MKTIIPCICPVCSYTLAVPFFDGGMQTLATLNWSSSKEEAQSMPRYPHHFMQCPSCSHVWNRSFDYAAIPYQKNPNRMFNTGGIWQGHLAKTRDILIQKLPETPTIIEIGCGEGHFIRGLSEVINGRFIGFDPNASTETGRGVEFYARLFEPLEDMLSFTPDMIIIRHVLEHLTTPASLIEQLAWGAISLNKPCYLFAEVPCIDRVFETNRLADFFYEHVGQFTTRSFQTLMAKAGEIIELAHGYNGEVVYSLVKVDIAAETQQRALIANEFAIRTEESRTTLRKQLDSLAKSGAICAIWGGTGKAAAFIHQFNADAERFPIVVDSDHEKVGFFVPNTGQEILFRDVLKSMHIDVVIIPTQWRAVDIVAEMKREGIHVEKILIENLGILVDFENDAHPYK
jgi:hypothetical protein